MFSLRNWRTWTFSFLCWTIYGILGTIGSLAFLISAGARLAVSRLVLNNLAVVTLWAGVSPLLFVLAKRYGFARKHWKKSVTIHTIISVAVTTSIACLIIAWNHTMGLLKPGVPFVANLIDVAFHSLPLCLAVMAIAHAAEYHGKFRERQLESSRLETKLAQAHLEILRSQLDPHFLFNTLNSIATLTRKDPEAAERMTLKLSSLLRVSLDANGSQEVRLQEELQFLESYLDIQQTRFRDRLTIQMKVDPEVLTAHVPSMILQPLAENAIRHGIAKSAAPGYLQISASKDHDVLTIEIKDNGPGMDARAQSMTEGFGLRNTRARLRQLYGHQHQFHIESSPGGGCRVTVTLPISAGSMSEVS